MGDRLTNFLLRLPSAVCMRARILYLRLFGVKLSGRCWIQKIQVPRNPWDIQIDRASLDRDVVLLTSGDRRSEPRIIIRHGCYFNRFTFIDATEQIEFGEGCFVGPHCYITDHDHGIKMGMPIGNQPLIGSPVRIGKGAWIGAGVTVLKGVQIGEGAVIGAGAVVTKDVAAFSIVAGVPARQIAARE